MKIFLNDRIVEFVVEMPKSISSQELVVSDPSPENIKKAYEEFERYEKWKRLLIPESASFLNLFKRIDAAGGLVRNEKGEYLFIHRLGFWDLPKGKIDKKDSPLPTSPGQGRSLQSPAYYAALREVKEETGLQRVSITKELPSTWHIYSEKGKRILKQTYWFAMEADSSQPVKPQTSEGIFLVKWTPVNAIHCILTHTYASIREMILEVVF